MFVKCRYFHFLNLYGALFDISHWLILNRTVIFCLFLLNMRFDISQSSFFLWKLLVSGRVIHFIYALYKLIQDWWRRVFWLSLSSISVCSCCSLINTTPLLFLFFVLILLIGRIRIVCVQFARSDNLDCLNYWRIFSIYVSLGFGRLLLFILRFPLMTLLRLQFSGLLCYSTILLLRRRRLRCYRTLDLANLCRVNTGLSLNWFWLYYLYVWLWYRRGLRLAVFKCHEFVQNAFDGLVVTFVLGRHLDWSQNLLIRTEVSITITSSYL